MHPSLFPAGLILRRISDATCALCYLFSFVCFFGLFRFLFARGVYVPLSVCSDATEAALANLCADELVPCGGHLDNQGYLMRPRGLEGAEEEGRMEGKLVEEFGGWVGG